MLKEGGGTGSSVGSSSPLGGGGHSSTFVVWWCRALFVCGRLLPFGDGADGGRRHSWSTPVDGGGSLSFRLVYG
jgi:hypothetical protein